MLGALDDEDLLVRQNAVLILGTLRSLTAIAPLKKILLDNSQPGFVRRNCAYALGQIGDWRATKALGQTITDLNTGVQKSAISALKTLGDTRALGDLMDQLKREDDQEVSDLIAETIGDLYEKLKQSKK
jgi:HEAT repeat protein